MQMTLLSVPLDSGANLFALVPGPEPLRRAQADDPIWKRLDVYQHWSMRLDVEKSRVRPVDRLKAFVK